MDKKENNEPQKVYLLLVNDCGHSSTPLGVFSTYEKAEKALKEANISYTHIEEFEVDAKILDY